MLDHLFIDRGSAQGVAECDARNVRVGAVARAGRVSARGAAPRQHTCTKGEWTDDLLFGLLASDWQRR